MTPTPSARRSHYLPALDGLRGLAVAAVLAFHGGLAFARGGFLGVSLFFTLSGYLITTLLLRERGATGRIRLKAFWARRLRRLVPASLLALALALWVTVVVVPVGQQAEAVGDIRAALANVANWRFIALGVPYGDLNRVASPVQHYWSLAIEEQFYLVFPLVAGLALRRNRPRVLGSVFVAVVAFAVFRQVTLAGVDRIYFGTDTRAAELAVGGLLALVLPRLMARPELRRWPLADGAGWFALGATVLLWWGAAQGSAALAHGGLAAVSVVSALLLIGAVAGGSLRRALSVTPLVTLGRISYGVYLYHFPLFLLLSPAETGLSPEALFVPRVALSLAVAAASYRYVERPIRTRAVLKRRYGRAPYALGAGFAAIALLSVAAMPGPSRPPGPVTVPARSRPVRAVTATTSSVPPPTVPSPPLDAITPISVEPAEAVPPPTAQEVTVPVAVPARAPRLVVIGDSTANGIAHGLQALAVPALSTTAVTQNGCTIAPVTRSLVRPGFEEDVASCDPVFTRAVATVGAQQADAVVVFLGSFDLADNEYPGMSGYHHLGEPAVDAVFAAAVERRLAQLEQAHVPIVVADTPVPAWDIDAFARRSGIRFPGVGSPVINDPARTARLNQLVAQVAARHPSVRILPFAEQLDPSLRYDGLHLDDAGVAAIADRWLVPDMARAYRAVELDPAAAVMAADRTTWNE